MCAAFFEIAELLPTNKPTYNDMKPTKDTETMCIASQGREPGLTAGKLERAGLTPQQRGLKRRELEQVAEMREAAKLKNAER